MKFAVLDDENTSIEEFRTLTEKLRPDSEIYSFNNEKGFFEYLIREDNKPECIFLDIQLNDASGIDTAKHVNELLPKIPVVFVTGYPQQYCQDIFLEHFDFEPFAFICKPVDEKVLGRVFEKLENKYKSSGTILHMRRSSKELLINTNELMYVESNRWYVVMHTVHGNEKVRAKLSAVSAMLPDRFVVSHKSYIVNPDFIRSFDSVSVVMQNGDILPISRSRKNEFRDKVLSAKGFDQC